MDMMASLRRRLFTGLYSLLEEKEESDGDDLDWGGGGMAWAPKISVEGTRTTRKLSSKPFKCVGTVMRSDRVARHSSTIRSAHLVTASPTAPQKKVAHEWKIEDCTPYSLDIYWDTKWTKCQECDDLDNAFERNPTSEARVNRPPSSSTSPSASSTPSSSSPSSSSPGSSSLSTNSAVGRATTLQVTAQQGKVLSALQQNRRPVKAKVLAQQMGIPKKATNSALYSLQGKLGKSVLVRDTKFQWKLHAASVSLSGSTAVVSHAVAGSKHAADQASGAAAPKSKRTKVSASNKTNASSSSTSSDLSTGLGFDRGFDPMSKKADHSGAAWFFGPPLTEEEERAAEERRRAKALAAAAADFKANDTPREQKVQAKLVARLEEEESIEIPENEQQLLALPSKRLKIFLKSIGRKQSGGSRYALLLQCLVSQDKVNQQETGRLVQKSAARSGPHPYTNVVFSWAEAELMDLHYFKLTENQRKVYGGCARRALRLGNLALDPLKHAKETVLVEIPCLTPECTGVLRPTIWSAVHQPNRGTSTGAGAAPCSVCGTVYWIKGLCEGVDHMRVVTWKEVFHCQLCGPTPCAPLVGGMESERALTHHCPAKGRRFNQAYPYGKIATHRRAKSSAPCACGNKHRKRLAYPRDYDGIDLD